MPPMPVSWTASGASGTTAASIPVTDDDVATATVTTRDIDRGELRTSC